MRNNRTILERLFAVVLCLVMLVGIVPAGAFRVYAEETADVALGTVEAVTEGLVVSGTEEVAVDNSGEKIVLEWARADATLGRYSDGWWVGVKITAPEDYEGGAFFNCYRYNGTNSTHVSFDENVDVGASDAITMWALITEEWARNEENISYTWEMDWNGDDSVDQTVKLAIDPANVQLVPAGVTLVECVTEGLKAEYDDTKVSVTIEEPVILEKVPADESIGRYADGWWVGVKITAPEYIDLADATFNCSRYEGKEDKIVSFADNTDTKGGNCITMWALITEEWVKNNETMEYQWEMCWSDPLSVDMTVNMSLDPAKIILLDEDGNKVAPIYGTLTSSLPGVLSGENSDNTTLTVSGYEIPFNAEKNGWFVDVSVVAPLECKEGKLGEEKLAASTTYYLELKPEQANDLDRYENISGEISGEFTWDGVAQTMTLKAENMTLLKANQAALTFEGSAPASQSLYTREGLNSYTRKASGGTTDSAIVYTSSDDKIATVDSNGKVSFKKEGTVTITATKDGGMYYNDAVACYSLTIAKDVWGLKFNSANPDNFVFGTDNNQFKNPATYITYGGSSSSNGVKYSIVSAEPSGSDPDAKVAEVDNNGTLTIYNVGTVTVQALKEENFAYDEQKVTYTLTIVPGTQELSFVEPETTITYSAKTANTYTYQVEGVLGTQPLTVTSSNEAVATAEVVDGAVIVTPHGSGSFILKASVATEDNYIGDDVEITVKVLTEQDNMAFEKPADVVMTYNDGGNVYENPVTGAQGTGTLTYTSSAPLVAAVDTAGKVTVYKAGEVTITAEKQSDGIYTGKTLTYKLTINKAEQDAALTKESETVANDVGSYTIGASAGELAAQKAFVYTLASKSEDMTNTNLVGNVVNIGEGEFGTVTVTVTREGDDCYLDWEDTFTLNVTQMAVNNSNFSITTEINPETGWYNKDVVIQYVDDGVTYNLAEAQGSGKNHKHGDKKATYTLSDGIYTDGDVILCAFKGKGGNHRINVCANNALGTIKVDTKAPQSSISYDKDVWGTVMEKLTFGYYDASLKVTVTATDNVSGIKEIKYKRIGLDEEFQTVAVNQSSDDATKPAQISFNVDPQFRGKIEFYAVDNAGMVEDTKITATTIVVDDMDPVLAQSYAFAKPEDVEGDSYNLENNIYYTQYKITASYAITEDNFDLADKPVITVNGSKYNAAWNAAGEAAVILTDDGDYVVEVSFADKSKNEMAPYAQEFRIDTKAPVITLEKLEGVCTKETITTTVQIEEHNFDADNTKITVTALDADGNAVDLKDLVVGEWTQTGKDIWQAEVQLVNSGIYTIAVASTDLAGNASEAQVANITVDKEAAQNIVVSYSDSVNLWNEILSNVTFGYYTYQESVTVTVTAEDKFSTLTGFSWVFKDEDGHVLSQSGKDLCALNLVTGSNTTYTGSFVIEAPARGYVEVVVYDQANNDSDKSESERINVVDKLNPGIVVTWPTAQRVVDNTNADVADYDYTATASECKLYYQEAVEATITITEANFFNGEPEGDSMKGVLVYDNGTPVALKNTEWTAGANDTWTNYVTLASEGEHVLTVDYTDRSNNPMTQYVSNVIVIDATAPVITLDPDYNEERKYFNTPKGLTADLIITETNFRAADVELAFESVNEAGKAIAAQPVTGTSYADFAKDDANWVHDGNKHTLTIPFGVDANYTLDVNYTDLAKREAEADHSEFTLDRVAPSNLDVSFSNNSVNPGYYGEAATVTLSASDDVAGIDRYDYSTSDGKVQGTTDGDFQINPQFKGTVSFTAYDKAGNSTLLEDNETIVVDSIAPKCNVTFNAPYKTVGNKAYYAQNIQVTINITEANFFSNDVKVAVTKDGAAYGAKVTWNGTTGSMVLNADGNYVINITYTDRSGNTMTPYTSQTLVLDTVTPVVKATNIKANSANKNDPYTFDIEISDINLDPTTMEPVLTAVLKDAKGNFTTQEIALEDPETVTANEMYRYTVENLSEDALYSLTCTVQDLAGNRMSQILLEDGDLYNVVQFSINREGSTFGYGDEYTEDTMNQYYVQDVDRDLVFVEVNVDPIEDFVITLNGKELDMGLDYTTVQSSEPGEWSKREYIINKNLFNEDGEYSIVIHSTDKANTSAYSDVKNLSTSFVVDKTAPVVTITGLESGGRYLTQEQVVTLIPTDEGGRLNTLKVVVMDADGLPLTDENGNDISVRFDMSGEELLAYLEENNGMVTFTVPEGLNNQVQIICTDCATDILSQTNAYDQTFDKVTVSQSQFVIFFANKPLFYGVIAGVLGFLLLLLLLFKRKKKEEEE